MSLCVQYQGSIPPQHQQHFITTLKEYTNSPVYFYENGEWETDGWNQRGWEPLLQSIKFLCSEHNVGGEMRCYYDDGDISYVTTYSLNGNECVETEEVDEL